MWRLAECVAPKKAPYRKAVRRAVIFGELVICRAAGLINRLVGASPGCSLALTCYDISSQGGLIVIFPGMESLLRIRFCSPECPWLGVQRKFHRRPAHSVQNNHFISSALTSATVTAEWPAAVRSRYAPLNRRSKNALVCASASRVAAELPSIRRVVTVPCPRPCTHFVPQSQSKEW